MYRSDSTIKVYRLGQAEAYLKKVKDLMREVGIVNYKIEGDLSAISRHIQTCILTLKGEYDVSRIDSNNQG